MAGSIGRAKALQRQLQMRYPQNEQRAAEAKRAINSLISDKIAQNNQVTGHKARMALFAPRLFDSGNQRLL